jgi:hypothetical protein
MVLESSGGSFLVYRKRGVLTFADYYQSANIIEYLTVPADECIKSATRKDKNPWHQSKDHA